jgi:hypothetical protein
MTCGTACRYNGKTNMVPDIEDLYKAGKIVDEPPSGIDPVENGAIAALARLQVHCSTMSAQLNSTPTQVHVIVVRINNESPESFRLKCHFDSCPRWKE